MKKIIVNCETGEEQVIDFTPEEIAQREIDAEYFAEMKAQEDAQAEAKAEAKASAVSKLAALGLTADDLKALGL